MRKETSFGVIPVRLEKGEWRVLLINDHEGNYWSFPKGHSEAGETAEQTASRELQEETGLTLVKKLTDKTFQEAYQFFWQHQKIEKTVTYFLAEVTGEIKIQQGEVLECHWFRLPDAEKRITFPESRSVLRQALPFLI